MADTLRTRTFDSITTNFANGVKSHAQTIGDINTATAADDTMVDQYFNTAGVLTLEVTTDTLPDTTAGTATLISLNSGGSVKFLNLAPAAIGNSDFVLV